MSTCYNVWKIRKGKHRVAGEWTHKIFSQLESYGGQMTIKQSIEVMIIYANT